MPFRLRSYLFRSIFSLAAVLVAASPAAAFPGRERKPAGGSLTEPPLNLVSAQAEGFALSPDDRFLVTGTGTLVKVIDTQTWLLYGVQVPALVSTTTTTTAATATGTESAVTTEANLNGNVKGLAFRNSTQLWIAQDDGDLIRFDSSDFATVAAKFRFTTKALGPIAVDPESGAGDDKIYATSPANKSLFVFSITDQRATELPLKDSKNQAVTPTDIVFIPFPTTAAPTVSVDKVFIATDAGLVLVLGEGGSTFDIIDIASSNKDNLKALSLSPEKNLLFVLDATKSAVFVVDTATNAVIDADGDSANGVTPVTFVNTDTNKTATNSSLTDLIVTKVKTPDDIYMYVSGASGLSVVDLNITATGFDRFTVLDLGTTDTANEPLALSSIPGPLAATVSTIGNIYTSTANAKISIVSDNPFVTASTSLSGSLGSSGSMVLTVQADETGTYSLRAGGAGTSGGTPLSFDAGAGAVASAALGTADTNASATATYAANSSAFAEGANRIFVNVTDAAGNVGWDSFDITVDTPPPAVAIVGEAFGAGKAAVTFERLSQSDILHYNIFAGSSAAAAQNAGSAATSVSQPASGDRVTGTVSGLANGTAVFLAVEAQDKAGNKSALRSVSNGIVPEETTGLVGILAEGGCILIPH